MGHTYIKVVSPQIYHAANITVQKDYPAHVSQCTWKQCEQAKTRALTTLQHCHNKKTSHYCENITVQRNYIAYLLHFYFHSANRKTRECWIYYVIIWLYYIINKVKTSQCTESILHTRHSATQCNVVQHSAAQCNTVQHVQHSGTQRNAVRHSATQCSTRITVQIIQCKGTETQCNTMQHNATH